MFNVLTHKTMIYFLVFRDLIDDDFPFVDRLLLLVVWVLLDSMSLIRVILCFLEYQDGIFDTSSMLAGKKPVPQLCHNSPSGSLRLFCKHDSRPMGCTRHHWLGTPCCTGNTFVSSILLIAWLSVSLSRHNFSTARRLPEKHLRMHRPAQGCLQR